MALSQDVPPVSEPAGLDVLRRLVLQVLRATSPVPCPALVGLEPLLSEAHPTISPPSPRLRVSGSTGTRPGSSGESQSHQRGDASGPPAVVDLVQRAQAGDADAFGQLYDRYVDGIYRFCYYRTSSVSLAEDLTSDTFFRALRAIGSFRWQGRDFGAWLTTIARNLVADHYKSSRSRLETVSDEVPEPRDLAPGPEDLTVTQLTHEVLSAALAGLPDDQRDCLVMRFLQGLSIAETAEALGRSGGAVKQLQLRAVRHLARLLPEDVR